MSERVAGASAYLPRTDQSAWRVATLVDTEKFSSESGSYKDVPAREFLCAPLCGGRAMQWKRIKPTLTSAGIERIIDDMLRC